MKRFFALLLALTTALTLAACGDGRQPALPAMPEVPVRRLRQRSTRLSLPRILQITLLRSWA